MPQERGKGGKFVADKRLRFTGPELEVLEALVIAAYSKGNGSERKRYANILRKIEAAPRA